LPALKANFFFNNRLTALSEEEVIMAVFIIIIGLAVFLQIAAKVGLNPLKSFRENARLATGMAFILIGISHFLMPEKYLEMMPTFLPAPVLLIYLSGLFEILGGIGLILSPTKFWAAAGLALLLLAVLPANIYVALNNVQLGGFMNYPLYQWIRLPMQFVLIGWIWWVKGETR
jgi:uncharacterized membrane protein